MNMTPEYKLKEQAEEAFLEGDYEKMLEIYSRIGDEHLDDSDMRRIELAELYLHTA